MIKTDEINKILGITENFQLHNALMEVLFDSTKKDKIFREFLEIESDLTYDWFTEYFQQTQSERDTLKQDYTPDCICKIVKGLVKDEGGCILDECAGIGVESES